MGLVDRRLKRLEEQITVPEDERRRQAVREFLAGLTDGELDWIESTDEAEAERRWQVLCERSHEILARDPQGDTPEARRYRLKKSREEQRAQAEENRRRYYREEVEAT